MTMPVHEHDCDACVYIASYPLRHPRCEHCWNTQHNYGHVMRLVDASLLCLDCYNDSDFITMADIYHTCDPGPSFYKFIVRYGKDGEYATTNQPHVYCLVPWVDGIDDFARECRICGMPDGQCYSLCPNSPAYYTAEQEREDEAWYGMDDNNERYAAERDAMKREGEMQ